MQDNNDTTNDTTNAKDPCKFKRINLVSVALFGALGT